MDFHGLIAFAALPFIAWIFSEDRQRQSFRLMGTALALQVLLALVLLKAPPFQAAFIGLNKAVLALEQATEAGTTMVFGYLGGGDLPFAESYPGAAFILAFRALPIILVMSALSALLYHYRILPWLVEVMAKALDRTLKLDGAASLAAAANVFVGMVEAPLLIRPYIQKLSRADLFLVMTTGMATIAGTMMVVYAGFLKNIVTDPLGHIVTASLISVPAAIMMARILVPPSANDETSGKTENSLPPSDTHGAMEAITVGTVQGVGLLINVVALILVMVALVSLGNQVLGLLPDVFDAPLTLERLLGWVMAPLVWCLGIPWAEAPMAGSLMGIKTVLNEFLAYLQLSQMPPDTFSPNSKIILTYALNGFANFGSLGIMIGGLASMAPERRGEIASLGLKSILAGTLATALTGAVAGLVYQL